MSLPLVLITGGTGFVGSHILHYAVESGYPVRAISRPGKAESLRTMYGSKIEVFVIDDIGTADFTEALKGVGAVIHTATPLPGREPVEQIVKTAINGAMHLLRQATEAGVPRFVLTSSITTVFDVDDPKAVWGNHIYTEADWNPATLETSVDEWTSYMAAKTVTEHKVWEFAQEHPEIDITSVNPPFVYGPFVPGFPVKAGDVGGMATVGFFYQNVMKGIKLPPSQLPCAPVTIDARDLGKIHVLALTAPTSAELGKRKRLVIEGNGFFWADAIEYLTKVRPELVPRLSDVSNVVKLPASKVDQSLATEVVGAIEHTDWRKTVEDMVTSILTMEENWRMEGWDIPN